MAKTNIGWCDEAINPIRAKFFGRVGHYCEKVSSGCANCYASDMQKRFIMPAFPPASSPIHGMEIIVAKDLLRALERKRKPSRIFLCSMTDLMGHWVTDEMIADILYVCENTPHTFLVLTKRAERLRNFSWPSNFQVGVSVENQAAANHRMDDLLACDAKKKWASYEPALGRVMLHRWLSHLSWVVAGGESGWNHRPAEVEWFEDVESQCDFAGVPFYMKQDSGPRPERQGRIPLELWQRKDVV